MKISVVIPTYNAATTIHATVDAVLRQTLRPYEILVLDDGSTDETIASLRRFKSRISLFPCGHHGVATARNALCGMASGDLIAFLDHDDIWHPNYLKTQARLFADIPTGAAFFTGHLNFKGYDEYVLPPASAESEYDYEIIDSRDFIKLYNKCPSPFNSMSFCCVPKHRLEELGPNPFPPPVSGVDDHYLFNVLPMLGPVVYSPAPLVAYRVTDKSQSHDRLKSVGLAVNAFELLAEQRTNLPRRIGGRAFKTAFASKRRTYAKLLIGAGEPEEGRKQLWQSLANPGSPLSLSKSAYLLLSTYFPRSVQPDWPDRYRA